MRIVLGYFKLLVYCAATAAWLRMCYKPLSWVSWKELIENPDRSWVGAILGAPLMEIHNFFAYGVVFISLAIVARIVGEKLTLYNAAFIGIVHGMVWFLIFSYITLYLVQWRSKEFGVLLLIYSAVGAVKGIFYHQIIYKK